LRTKEQCDMCKLYVENDDILQPYIVILENQATGDQTYIHKTFDLCPECQARHGSLRLEADRIHVKEGFGG
jgi:hypothetical protein